MTEMAPAVALLFDDIELVGQLREALQERGARIVHEGGVASLSRELLQRVGADVLVINLDDSADDALDRLYDVIDDEHPRVVFNDAQASRSLSGWDRARWARHLAVKVLAAGDVDPPRPAGLELVDNQPAPAVAEPLPAEPTFVPTEPAVMAEAAVELAPMDEFVVEASPAATEVAEFDADADSLPLHDAADGERGQIAAVESENLAAELEALLASGELPEEDEVASGPGLRFAGEVEPPPLHDGHFGRVAAEPDVLDTVGATADQPQIPAGATPPTFQIDHLELSALTDADVTTIPASASHPNLAPAAPTVQAPDNWALVDDDAAPAAPEPEMPNAGAFGIQKVSAADFLAPDADVVGADIEPVMSLELVSMEEAVAPQPYEPALDHEMLLDDLGGALSRLVVLGAAVDGMESVCEFLAALPADTRLTFLHTQHLGEQSDVAVAMKFKAHCGLPLRLAEQGSRAVPGEVLMVPAGQHVRLRRDGSIELQPTGVEGAEGSSIDASLTMAANVFGRDALAIVFAGRGNDAVGGAQAVHDRGGQVWVESSSGDHFADMVSGIFAERLVSFSGTPTELAARLIEVFP